MSGIPPPPLPPPSQAEQELISKLSNRELELLRERSKKDAMRRCDEVVKVFVECSRPRFISTIWACRTALQEMNDCVLKNNTDLDFERQKLLYIRSKDV